MFWFECEMPLIGSKVLNAWFLAAVLRARGTLKRWNLIGGSLSLRTGLEVYSLATFADLSLLSLPRYEQESAYSHHHSWELIFHPCLLWHGVLYPQNMTLNKSSSLKLLLARYLVTVVRQVTNARGKQQVFITLCRTLKSLDTRHTRELSLLPLSASWTWLIKIGRHGEMLFSSLGLCAQI